jgi:hypothetical protein
MAKPREKQKNLVYLQASACIGKPLEQVEPERQSACASIPIPHCADSKAIPDDGAMGAFKGEGSAIAYLLLNHLRCTMKVAMPIAAVTADSNPRDA